MRNSWLVYLTVAIVAFTTTFGLGFARSGSQVDLKSLSEGDLAMIYAKTLDEVNKLESAKTLLTEDLNKMQNQTQNVQAINEEQEQTLQKLKALACDSPLTGSGVRIIINVPENTYLGWDWAITLVNNAYSAGALGVSVNNVRLSPKWYIYYEGGHLNVDGTNVNGPFVFDIVGEPDSVLSAMYLPSGVFDTLQLWGVKIEHELKPKLTIKQCNN
ncbi:DUF881 domain-containing protein [Coprothermobacter platensis]|uniref:DUF881 domain-containing protein n=1 Tax=Coprothermobacter platensis TaxID=108819 RepID=UPI00036D3B2A|nr:DUF881 domain-containing protein [Coprothermobacter platensis]